MLLAGSAAAQGTVRTTAPTQKKAPAPHSEGDYGGVHPGQAPKADPGKPGKPKKLPAPGTLSWIGFDAKDGGAEVFFQAVAPFTASQRVEGATLIVHLDLTRLGGNTWRPVETRFFDNPLARITAKPVRAGKGKKQAAAGGIDVRIAFKNPKDAREATMRAASEADGMYYVHLSFPAGTAVEPSARR